MASALRLIKLVAASTSSHGNTLCSISQVLGPSSMMREDSSTAGTSVLRRSAFFWKRKDTKEQESLPERRKMNKLDGQTTAAHMQTLKNTSSAVAMQGYKPPDQVTEHLCVLVAKCVDALGEDWQSISLQDRRLKFKLLSLCLQEFSHMVPSHSLAGMVTVQDVLDFYRTPVKDASALESLNHQRLPPNLHVQLEPLRFHEDTDTLFGGKTAFPDQPTVVKSIKYRHKYKGTEE